MRFHFIALATSALVPATRAFAPPLSPSLTRAPVKEPSFFCCAPPPLKDADAYSRGALAVDGADFAAWWRQDVERFELIVEMPDDASFKRDVKIELSRKKISLTMQGKPVAVGNLPHDISADDSEWFVEDDLDGFEGDRYLMVSLKKLESYVDWTGPLMGETRAPKKLVIGGKGEAQKLATAQQLASYQVIQKLPATIRGDVYARVPPSEDGTPSTTLYFVGKVIAETAEPAASLAAQELLVKEHARLYQPSVFADCADEKLELWLAPGNSEMRVAQNKVALTRWEPPSEDTPLPSAGACGFEPETAPPPHMGNVGPLKVERAANGLPVGVPFDTNLMSPSEVPGAYEAWLKDQ